MNDPFDAIIMGRTEVDIYPLGERAEEIKVGPGDAPTGVDLGFPRNH